MPRSAFITGAAMGMGMLMARDLARRGWRVFAGVAPGLETSALTDGVDLAVVEQDVSDEDSVAGSAGVVAGVLAGAGLDLLINNAGVAGIATGPIEGVDMAETRRLFEINTFGQLRVVRHFLPMLHESRQSPRIINFASGAVRVPMPCSGIYNMSKYAVEGLTNTLRYELAPFGIQATSIEPGAVKTHMTADPVRNTDRIWEQAAPHIRQRYEARLRPCTEKLGRSLIDCNDPQYIVDRVLALVDVPHLKSRYTIGKEANMLPLLQWLLPESAFEKAIVKKFMNP
ncbi:MAG: SDR family NAD(P)-dependent oxidoreductase [Proteobacteria bacterium]|nr:SDR family NAD(P)-dependent oxidoreductase [Pseudomonadota bacterium]HQR04593.1 SDR family NAD(P)-dependent oxidoreductase [Rhodocyclaceae bacterium]